MKADQDGRRLAVVMFADLVGYSRLMANDGALAMAAVRGLERAARSQAAAAGGRLVKCYGDGALLEFPTVRAAVDSAYALRDRLPEDCGLPARIGLHLGELIADGDDVYGDAVNIAARVQQLAGSGGIAMTGGVYSQARGQVPLNTRLLRGVRLKNIPERMTVHLVEPRELSLAGRLAWEWAAASPRWPRTALAAAAAGVVALAGLWDPVPAQSPAGAPDALAGARLYRELRCAYCHALGGVGGRVGPALDDIARREDDRWLFAHFKDPGRVTPGSRMPRLELYDNEIWHLIAFLRSQPPHESQR